MRGARGQEGRVWGEAGKQALDTLDLKWEPPWSATGHAGPGFLLVLKDQAPSELGGSLETTFPWVCFPGKQTQGKEVTSQLRTQNC